MPASSSFMATICDGELATRLLRDRGITTIVHFAAESHVDRSIVGPEEFIRTNVIGTHKLFQAACAAWMPVGGRNQWRNIDVVRLVCDRLDAAVAANPALAAKFPESPATGGGSSQLLTFVRDRPGHDRRYAANCTKLERELGFRPRESFESGLEKTGAWYLEHEHWWRGVMDGSYRVWMPRQYGDPRDDDRDAGRPDQCSTAR